jgi:hypothetical protein
MSDAPLLVISPSIDAVFAVIAVSGFVITIGNTVVVNQIWLP